ncbi:MAG: insulinase family protein [Saprospiraceae bacterium]|nr:insulinase family protein [Saprospiraceae bacterium]
MNATASFVPTKPKYDFETVAGDPIGVKSYTLQNGMKLFMSINKNEPRIYTNITVRAGSKQDPAETTGLAHYLEHMMFKGTNQIGALDWDNERLLLKKIADLYEQHKAETDPSVRKALYAQIDSVSNLAAKLVAANEYDKLVASLGAKATNANTWHEHTIYVNDIPSNELERWLELEAERFKMVVLRLFHTELEAVYEEFNISQDNDGRKVQQAMLSSLFPAHPYGTQTTIGKGEHLKSPSHYNILKYFETYYVPNNMAIVLSGDLDPDKTVALVEKTFGSYQRKEVPPFKFDEQPILRGVQKREVIGQQAAYVQLGWRLNAGLGDVDLANMVGSMLYNRQAGLIDLDLVQQQKVLEASAGMMNLADYSALMLYGRPREGQTLEDVERLLVEQINRLKKGDFPDWLMSAVVKDYKYSMTKSFENNTARVNALSDAFIKGISWDKYIGRLDRMKALTKQQIVEFVNKNFGDNYVVVYKKAGADPSVLKVEKPKITPVSLNRKDKSPFASEFFKQESPRLSPEFVDFQKAISTSNLKSGIKLDYIKNETNETFSLYYIVEMGKNADKTLALAISYLPFLGTDKYSAAQLQQEFYKLGLSFDVFSNDDRSYVTLSGLEESFTEGVKLFEHILKNVKGDEKALKNMVADILAKRENDKKDKRIILRNAMASYAKYGKMSPFTDALTTEELNLLTANTLVEKIKGLSNYEHRIFYYGTKSQAEVGKILNDEHAVPRKLKPIYSSKEYPELSMDKNKVLFVHFPMVQAEILMVSKGTPQYSVDEQIMSTFYNNYFGSGLSSIVFQEIREARALAYSANAFYSTPAKRERGHYFNAYVGTQADKLKDAITAMHDIIEDMPISETQIEQARQSVLKTIESERITKSNIYWTYRNNLDRGIENDLRKAIYEVIQTSTADDLKEFQQKHVKGRNYTILVLGDRSKLDFGYLQSLGEVKELSLEEVFGY